MEGDPEFIFNHDVLFLYDMCNRFITELERSQSNGVSGMTVHDQTRMLSYIDALNQKMDWIENNPLLDLPETHPRQYELKPKPTPQNVESEVVNQYIRLVEAFRTEAINGQSARYASTVITHDIDRLRAITAKMLNFMQTYVQDVTPLDLPESSPLAELAPHGAKGV